VRKWSVPGLTNLFVALQKRCVILNSILQFVLSAMTNDDEIGKSWAEILGKTNKGIIGHSTEFMKAARNVNINIHCEAASG